MRKDLSKQKKQFIGILNSVKIPVNPRTKKILLSKYFDWINTDFSIKNAIIHLKYSHGFTIDYSIQIKNITE